MTLPAIISPNARSNAATQPVRLPSDRCPVTQHSLQKRVGRAKQRPTQLQQHAAAFRDQDDDDDNDDEPQQGDATADDQLNEALQRRRKQKKQTAEQLWALYMVRTFVHC